MPELTSSPEINRYGLDVKLTANGEVHVAIQPSDDGDYWKIADLRHFENECERIGKWLSAALDDPNTCAEFKNDIRHWFNSKPF
ncbi:hypothetical protein ID853_15755 [Xenorhabdus sp. Vera]|uniref:hypothetical protein n=1 Tax=Xenorhabdus koppenhoeferi TaxID=351659 RepID=UPI0019978448|nr:hypothetical protein [Xenorhabdus sp. Vera]MBD2812294.1 hypothetical protein [Xenorhabdus sp. Vera]